MLDMAMEEKTSNKTIGNYGEVRDRIEDLRDDMEDGFSDLRSKVQEMDANELRREMSLLMMIGSSQMDAIRRQRREIDGMNVDLIRLNNERSRIVYDTMNLLANMDIAFDSEDDCPSKWIRMAASVAEKRRCEPITTTAEELGVNAVTDLDRKESTTETAMVVIMGVFVLCVIVWTAMMVAAWV